MLLFEACGIMSNAGRLLQAYKARVLVRGATHDRLAWPSKLDDAARVHPATNQASGRTPGRRTFDTLLRLTLSQPASLPVPLCPSRRRIGEVRVDFCSQLACFVTAG